MAEQTTSTVREVDEPSATGRVAEIYADIKATKNLDFVPRFWKVLATSPPLLESTWTHLKSVMHPEQVGRTAHLTPLVREIIAVAVSATNGCPYCINSHTTAVLKLGLDVESLGEVMAVVGLFNATNTLAEAYQVQPDVLPPRE